MKLKQRYNDKKSQTNITIRWLTFNQHPSDIFAFHNETVESQTLFVIFQLFNVIRFATWVSFAVAVAIAIPEDPLSFSIFHSSSSV